MGPILTSTIETYLSALERRFSEGLAFSEIRKGIQALSGWYVERRGRMTPGRILDGRGKQAAFALFFGPLHLLAVCEIGKALGVNPTKILDLGCGTGAAGAGLALSANALQTIQGFDVHPFAVQEARRTYQHFGWKSTANRKDLQAVRIPKGSTVLLGYALNELSIEDRRRLVPRLLTSGAQILIVEPIARIIPEWDDWVKAFEDAGGRHDEWKFEIDLPKRLADLDRAAGLDHRILKARSLHLPPPPDEAPSS